MPRRNGKVESMVAKLYTARQEALKGEAPPDDAFRSQFPFLWDVLTHVWLTESVRVAPGTISVTPVGQEWLWRVRSPSVTASTAVSTPTWDQGLAALEAHLGRGPQVWQFTLRGKAKTQVLKDLENSDLDNLTS